jgi:hypothetical protein
MFEVSSQLSSWPEQHQRKTQWFNLQDAVTAVQEPSLCAIIASLETLVLT